VLAEPIADRLPQMTTRVVVSQSHTEQSSDAQQRFPAIMTGDIQVADFAVLGTRFRDETAQDPRLSATRFAVQMPHRLAARSDERQPGQRLDLACARIEPRQRSRTRPWIIS